MYKLFSQLITRALFSLLIASGMLFSVGVPTVGAADITVGFTNPSSVILGNDVTVQVTYSSTNDASHGTEMYVSYNKDLLEYRSNNADNSIFNFEVKAVENNASTGIIRFDRVTLNSAGFKGTGKIIDLTFRAKTVGTADFSIGDNTVISYGPTSQSFTKGTGSVQIKHPEPIITSFDADPSGITAGGKSRLSWNIQNPVSTVVITPGNITVEASGSTEVSPTETTEYTITATGQSGDVRSRKVTVTVTPPAPTIGSFKVEPSSATAGSPVTITWSVSGATSVSISPGIGNVGAQGSQVIRPTGTTKYTLTATSAGGTRTAEVVVDVAMPVVINQPEIKTFTVKPDQITKGNSAKLTWLVNNATEVKIDNVNANDRGEKTVNPTSTTRYVLTAKNAAGQSTKTVTLKVVDPVVVAIVPPVTATAKPTTIPTATPTAVATPSSKVDIQQSTVVFNKTSAVADGVETITVSIILRTSAGEVITDIVPSLSGLRDKGDTASPFTLNEAGDTWESQVSSTVPGLISTVITADTVTLANQDLTFIEPIAPADTSTDDNTGMSFTSMLLIGFLLLILLLLLLIFIWRRLRKHDDEEQEGEYTDEIAYADDQTALQEDPNAYPVDPATQGNTVPPVVMAPVEQEQQPPALQQAPAVQQPPAEQLPPAEPQASPQQPPQQ